MAVNVLVTEPIWPWSASVAAGPPAAALPSATVQWPRLGSDTAIHIPFKPTIDASPSLALLVQSVAVAASAGLMFGGAPLPGHGTGCRLAEGTVGADGDAVVALGGDEHAAASRDNAVRPITTMRRVTGRRLPARDVLVNQGARAVDDRTRRLLISYCFVSAVLTTMSVASHPAPIR